MMLRAGVFALIALGLPAWAAALLSGIAVTGIGYVLIRFGIAALRPQELKPRQTMATLKEDAQWLMNRLPMRFDRTSTKPGPE